MAISSAHAYLSLKDQMTAYSLKENPAQDDGDDLFDACEQFVQAMERSDGLLLRRGEL